MSHNFPETRVELSAYSTSDTISILDHCECSMQRFSEVLRRPDQNQGKEFAEYCAASSNESKCKYIATNPTDMDYVNLAYNGAVMDRECCMKK